MKMLHRLRTVIGLVVCLGLLSCDLFKTRTPEEPDKSSDNYVPPTDPGLVLQNMVHAFSDRNAANYVLSFSDISFNFEATASARSKYVGDFISWDKAKERNYFDVVMSAVNQNNTVVLEFGQFTPRPYADSSEIDVSYHLSVPHTMAGIPKNFDGQAQFMLIRSPQTGRWSIRQWIDLGLNSSDSTWSDLKGAFAQ
jgi:hypothetical protein